MPETATPETLPWEIARNKVIHTVRSLGRNSKSESVPLEQAHGRVLSEAVLADRDYPSLRRSLAVDLLSRDGLLMARAMSRD